MSRHLQNRLLTLTLMGVYLLALTLPLLCLIYFAWFGFNENFNHVWKTTLSDYVLNTLYLLPTVALGAILLGISTAWLTVNYDFPGKRWLVWLLAIPFCIPPYIHGFLYSEILEAGGPIHRFFTFLGWESERWFEFRSFWGCVLIFSISLYPYIYLPCRLVLTHINRHYRLIADTLATNDRQFIIKVVAPMSISTVVSGVVLVWMDVISDYGLVEYYGVATISIGVLRAWFGMGDLYLAATLSVLLMIFVAGLLWLCHRAKIYFSYRERAESDIDHWAPKPIFGWQRLATIAGCLAVVSITSLIPIAKLIYWVVAGWSSIDFSQLWSGVVNTTFISVLAAGALLVCCFLLCYAQRVENQNSYRRFYRNLSAHLSLSYALPGAVVATGVIIAISSLHQWLGWHRNNLLSLFFGLIPLLLAYQIRFSAVALSNLSTGFSRISRATDDTARMLGVGGMRLLWKVYLPMMKHPISTACILLTINIIKELPMTAFLRPIGFDTLAVDAFLKILDERPVQAAPGALMIVLLSVALFYLLRKTLSLDVKPRFQPEPIDRHHYPVG